MGELRIIGRKSAVMAEDTVEGDLKLTWRKDKLEEVALAGKTFKEYIGKGWLAIGETSGKKSQIFTFNPDYDRIVLAPLLMGG
ncbi:MAG: hypothetical protein V1850_07665 [Candidatus Bathyarchaeota archaeon]